MKIYIVGTHQKRLIKASNEYQQNMLSWRNNIDTFGWKKKKKDHFISSYDINIAYYFRQK